MDVMWAALVVVVVVVTVVAAVSVLRRPRGSDLNSVRQYHSALGTIEQMSARSGQSSVRVVGQPGGPGNDPGLAGAGHPDSRSGSMAPATPGEGDHGLGRGGPLVFDDARPVDGNPVDPSARPATVSRTDRAQRHALHSMNRRPRRGTAVMAAVVVLVLFGALAFIGSRRSPSADHPHSATTVADPRSSGRSTTTSTTTSSTTSGTSRHKSHAHGKTGTPRPTPTTIPTAIVASSSTPGSAVYPVAANSYRVLVSVTAPCWVQATTLSTGATLWTGTLQAGANQVIEATGVVKVELGAPGAILTVDNVPVTLPTPEHTPFEATFQPSLTAAPGSTTTLAPTTTTTTFPAG